MRRNGLIDRQYTISWNSVDNEIWIYTDFGRMMRPLLIIDNNIDDIISKKTDKFVQNIRLTKEVISMLKSREITFEDLIATGYVEYIFPGEEVLLCPSLKRLKETMYDITEQWTHCDVEQALYGPSALIGPFLEHNGQTRNTLVTVHSKQSCGQPMKNIHTATLRQLMFHQHRVDNPLVNTIIQQFLPPNSQTLMVLYTVMLGYNMEDSAILNRASVDSGLLRGTFYKMEMFDIEKNYILKIPKEDETSLYKKHLSYSKLDDSGCVPVGSLISRGDILLGVVIEVSKPAADGKLYVDKSLQYNGEETGRVVSITKKIDGNKKFYRFTFEFIRDMTVGDKISSRAGNKNIIALLIPPQDMPYTLDGQRPDLILNPHSIPTRMTPAQLFETSMSKLCAKKGIFIDGTVFRKYNVYELFKELEKEGIALKDTLINGSTGEAYDALMFYGPQTIFRLPKFVLEDRHAVGRSGPLDPITSQAVTGKKMHGGHKVGEMELWVYMTQGAMSCFHEEFYLDSDYRKIYICRGCNELATYNPTISRYKCRICKDNVDICAVDSCKTTTMVIQELMSANIKLKAIPEKRKYEKFL
jgi:DNA-directed RNA polymerase beta subunit